MNVAFPYRVSDLSGVLGKPEEVERVRSMTLDEQLSFVKVKKYGNYVKITERFLTGSPTEMIEDLNNLTAMGFDQIIAGGLETVEDLHRFAEEVIPHVS